MSIVAETGLTLRSLWLDFGACGIDWSRLDAGILEQKKFQTAWAAIFDLRLEHLVSVETDFYCHKFILNLLKYAKHLKSFGIGRGNEFLFQLSGSRFCPKYLEAVRLKESYIRPDTLLELLLPSSNSIRGIVLDHVFLPAESS